MGSLAQQTPHAAATGAFAGIISAAISPVTSRNRVALIRRLTSRDSGEDDGVGACRSLEARSGSIQSVASRTRQDTNPLKLGGLVTMQM